MNPPSTFEWEAQLDAVEAAGRRTIIQGSLVTAAILVLLSVRGYLRRAHADQRGSVRLEDALPVACASSTLALLAATTPGTLVDLSALAVTTVATIVATVFGLDEITHS